MWRTPPYRPLSHIARMAGMGGGRYECGRRGHRYPPPNGTTDSIVNDNTMETVAVVPLGGGGGIGHVVATPSREETTGTQVTATMSPLSQSSETEDGDDGRELFRLRFLLGRGKYSDASYSRHLGSFPSASWKK